MIFDQYYSLEDGYQRFRIGDYIHEFKIKRQHQREPDTTIYEYYLFAALPVIEPYAFQVS
jgi:hypothetical protein